MVKSPKFSRLIQLISFLFITQEAQVTLSQFLSEVRPVSEGMAFLKENLLATIKLPPMARV